MQSHRQQADCCQSTAAHWSATMTLKHWRRLQRQQQQQQTGPAASRSLSIRRHMASTSGGMESCGGKHQQSLYSSNSRQAAGVIASRYSAAAAAAAAASSVSVDSTVRGRSTADGALPVERLSSRAGRVVVLTDRPAAAEKQGHLLLRKLIMFRIAASEPYYYFYCHAAAAAAEAARGPTLTKVRASDMPLKQTRLDHSTHADKPPLNGGNSCPCYFSC
jgi:hypothetical protein